MGTSFDRGVILYRQKRYVLAADEFRKEISAAPSSARAHAMLGLSLLCSNQREPAEAQVREAIRLAPNDAYGYFAMNFVEMRAPKASRFQSFRLRFLQAERAARAKRLRAARESMRRALAIEPSNADYIGQLAAIEFDLRRWKPALEHAQRGLSHSPQHRQCSHIRARALARIGRRREAVETTDQTLRIDPEHAPSHITRGWLMYQMGRYQIAQDHFLEALRIAPSDTFAQRGLRSTKLALHPVYGLIIRPILWISGRRPRHFLSFLWITVLVVRPLCENKISPLPLLMGCVLVWFLAMRQPSPLMQAINYLRYRFFSVGAAQNEAVR